MKNLATIILSTFTYLLSLLTVNSTLIPLGHQYQFIQYQYQFTLFCKYGTNLCPAWACPIVPGYWRKEERKKGREGWREGGKAEKRRIKEFFYLLGFAGKKKNYWFL